jgi:hypothetical protein
MTWDGGFSPLSFVLGHIYIHTKTPGGVGRGSIIENTTGRRAKGIVSDGCGLRKGVIQRPWRNGSR